MFSHPLQFLQLKDGHNNRIWYFCQPQFILNIFCEKMLASQNKLKREIPSIVYLNFNDNQLNQMKDTGNEREMKNALRIIKAYMYTAYDIFPAVLKCQREYGYDKRKGKVMENNISCEFICLLKNCSSRFNISLTSHIPMALYLQIFRRSDVNERSRRYTTDTHKHSGQQAALQHHFHHTHHRDVLMSRKSRGIRTESVLQAAHLGITGKCN